MPPLPGVYGAPATPPIGLGYTSEYLTANNIENDVMDMRLGYGLEELKRKIKEFKPDLIGFAVLTYRHDVPYSLISSIKSKDYDIIVGGPHASTIRKQILEETEADYAQTYEAEQILIDLCNGIPLAEIRGLIYKKGNEIIENKDAPFLDLNKLPFPKYRKFELSKYVRPQINIASSRGCPYSCTFCTIATTVGKPVRVRTPESILEEIKYWYTQGYKTFDIIDDHFLYDKERVAKICDEIVAAGIKDLYLICGNGIRADKIDGEILKKMTAAGFKQFSIGVDAGNDKMLKLVKKGENMATIENAIKLSCEAGINVSLFFVVGIPGETPADVHDSMNLALKYPVNNANFYNVTPIPGTELYEEVKRRNLFVVKHPDYLNDLAYFDTPIFETPEFPLEERRKILNQTKKVEKEILRRTYVRKLKAKFGILSNLTSYVVFSKPVYSALTKANKDSMFLKKMLIMIANKFDLRRMEAVR